MHTVLVILGGFVLLAITYAMALWHSASLRRAFPVYAILWVIASAINLWIGVTHAGYSVSDELPIFVVVFGIPCAVAWFVSRRSA
ncbi:hypothetical protein PAF17_12860 [Paracoccus sp. Z330]|uniref:Uncharacterized protein n=1 Tax=Paracoccus onchidii TaxID=3017813 RepID=A0ABT4ZHD0_9RHOB|nr:hypothetical protein [Paracoccus onchidii]MDB6178388.1 hypothetical protein [Paracoccus onchidii]